MKDLILNRIYDKHYKKEVNKMGKGIKNKEKHEIAAAIIKYVKTLRPDFSDKEVRNVCVTAYHDITKILKTDEKSA